MTFSEQLTSNDVVVVAKLLEVPPPSDDPDADFPKAQFEIVQVIKGVDFVAPEMKFSTQLVGTYPIGEKFLVMGVDPPKLAWTTPMKASDRVFQYLQDIQSLPAKGPKRLEFFQNFFEDKESILAFDAYDEFALASYPDLIAMKDQLQHDKLIAWILDPEISVNRRRLYFTLLGICGTAEDTKVLEDLIRSNDRKKRAGLDALIASYLTLKGPAGVDLIEEIFLVDTEADYVDANAAVMALRFHGTELKLIPKERIVVAIRHLLDRPKMADMIIPDLARWEDWSVMERLVQMFKDADEESNWLRVPVITYLRACPKPEAKVYIEELSKIDPESVRRADFFLGGFGDEDSETEDSGDEESVKPATESPKKIDPPQTADPSAALKLVGTASAELLSPGSAADLLAEREVFVSSISGNSAEVSIDTPAISTGTGSGFEELNVATGSHVVLKVSVDPAPLPVSPGQVGSKDRSVDSEVEMPVTGNKTMTKSIPTANRDDSTFVSNSSANRGAAIPVADVAPTIVETSPIAAVAVPNLTWSIIFVPMGISLLLFLLLWCVVNGWFERLIF